MKSFVKLFIFFCVLLCTTAIELYDDEGLPAMRNERLAFPTEGDESTDSLEEDETLENGFAHADPDDDANSSFNYIVSDLVVYANGKYEIIVKDLNSKKTRKVFTIQIEKPNGGIVVDYKRDLLFFVHRNKVFRIHLVDDDGERKRSLNGDLFTNDSANHVELAYQYALPPTSESHLVYDEKQGWLYLMDGNGYFKINCETMEVLSTGAYMLPTPTSIVLHQGMFFTQNGNTIYNISQDALEGISNRRKTWDAQKLNMEFTRFILDKSSNRIFFTMQKNVLGVLEGNIFESQLSSLKLKIVMADSSYTKDIGSLAIHKDTMIWSSHAWKLIYIGKLNEKLNFISKSNVDVLDESMYESVQNVNNIQIVNVNGVAFKK